MTMARKDTRTPRASARSVIEIMLRPAKRTNSSPPSSRTQRPRVVVFRPIINRDELAILFAFRSPGYAYADQVTHTSSHLHILRQVLSGLIKRGEIAFELL